MSKQTRFRALLDAARTEKLSRRAVLKRAAVLGLSAPAIATLLAACGGGSANANITTTSTTAPSGGMTSATPTSSSSVMTPTSQPVATARTSTAATGATRRGGQGELRLLWWEAPIMLNPAFSSGTKDFDASRLVLEPLLDRGQNNELVPVLAAEVPSLANGQVAQDGMSVTFRLRQNVTWHDGTPFSANDVIFNWRYNTGGIPSYWDYSYEGVQLAEAVDEHTIRFTFRYPHPAWWRVGMPFLLPEHLLKQDIGNTARAKSDPLNLHPVGTGPYKVQSFTPNDVGVYVINADYWDPGKPHFDKIVMQGGGTAESAARAVLQTGEGDWAWNLQLEPTVLEALGTAKGKIVAFPGGGCERLMPNYSDPLKETDGQRSYYQNPHPHFTVLEVRQALDLALDRQTIATTLYGLGGTATGSDYHTNPAIMPPGIEQFEYNLDKANTLLDQAGATRGSDGVRVLNGRRMSWLYQTSTNDVRQKTQAIIKDSCRQLGIELQLKTIDASIFFGDPAGNESWDHFLADLEMGTHVAGYYPDLWFKTYYSDPPQWICQKSNDWNGTNYIRYQSTTFNQMHDEALQLLEPVAYTKAFQAILKYVNLEQVVDWGLINRKNVNAAVRWLDGYQNFGASSSSILWDVKDWFRQKG